MARLPGPISAYAAFVLCIIANFAIRWLDLNWLDRNTRIEILDGLIGAAVVAAACIVEGIIRSRRSPAGN